MFYRKGIIRSYGNELSIFHRALDVLLILGILWVCAKGYDVHLGLQYGLAGMAAVVSFLFLSEWHALYSSWRAASIRHEVWLIISIWLFTCLLLLALFFFSKLSIQFSRVTILAWAMTTPVALIVERVLLRYALRRFRKLGFNSRSVAIVGGGKSAAQLVDIISGAPWMGLKIDGLYDDAEKNNDGNFLSTDVDALLQRVQDGLIDCVYITYPMQQEDRIRQIVERLADSTVSVHVVPDAFVSELFYARWSSLGNMPLVSVFESPFFGASMFFKRIEDIVLGSLILLLISPLMLLIAIAVKVTDRGPVIFRQRRYGLNGQLIEVWKFRSMFVHDDKPHIQQAQKNDLRITPLGAFLRRTSLDELPQFINVLQGQMSIVGPRPHAVAHNEEYRKLIYGYMLRHKVKPGITGLAQVHGWRGETDTMEKMEMRVKYDLEYINNWSIWLDLTIIAKTVISVFQGKNAY